MQQALLIHNDGAGDGKIDAKALSHVLDAAGISLRHCTPKDPNLAECLAEAADLVIVAGGDGTVARILSQMPDFPGRRIAIVPLGTANNIAQSLRILSSDDPGAGEEILSGWQHADRRQLDIGLATGPWGESRFVEALGLGPLARTVIEFKPEGVDPVAGMRLGRKAFADAVEKCGPLKSTVTIDGETIGDELLMAEIMNIQHAGSRVHLAPQADPGDGELDLVTLAPSQRADFIDWLENGGQDDQPPVTVRRGREVLIDWRGDPLRIDDSAPKTDVSEGRIRVALASQCLSILVPSALDREAETSKVPA